MKTRNPVIAVFDIGKTNKKLLVFDEQYKVVQEELVRFDEVMDDDGFPCENIDALTSWILQKYGELKTSDRFLLKAVNFSTYGASMVHLDAAGKRIGYLYNYLKPYPDELMQRFLNNRGRSESVAEHTSSPIMGHLNAGMQLYWIKEYKPELFQRIAASLHFPQYLSFLLTGKKFAEMTNVGCHSAMWDFAGMHYHPWLKEEGIQQKLSVVIKGDTVVELNENGESDNVVVGVGLHDSSAATIPYLAGFSDPFVILSTGTWAISLNPFNSELPRADELEKGCLSYLTYQGMRVKTTMLFAGNDHDQQAKRIAAHFKVDPDYFKALEYDTAIVEKLKINSRSEQGNVGEPALRSATTPCAFQGRDLSAFDSPEEAYHQLVADIAAQQFISTAMVLSNSVVQNIYVDGGFCKNKIYMQLLANAFSDKKLYAASMIQGTALGAALALHRHWNSRPLPKGLMALQQWRAN